MFRIPQRLFFVFVTEVEIMFRTTCELEKRFHVEFIFKIHICYTKKRIILTKYFRHGRKHVVAEVSNED